MHGRMIAVVVFEKIYADGSEIGGVVEFMSPASRIACAGLDAAAGIRYLDVPVAVQQAGEAFAVQKGNDAAPVEAPGSLSFCTVWRMYGKPVGNAVWLERQWNALPDTDKEAILGYVPLYVAERPDPKYRKNFSNFLAERTWEMKPITPTAYGKYGQQDNGIATTGVCARDDAADLTEELIARCGDSGGRSV